MLTVSKAALIAIKEHLCEHGFAAAVRVAMMGGSCAGENLRFTLDETQSGDLRFVFDHVTFLIDRSLSVRCGAIAVDFAAESLPVQRAQRRLQHQQRAAFVPLLRPFFADRRCRLLEFLPCRLLRSP